MLVKGDEDVDVDRMPDEASAAWDESSDADDDCEMMESDLCECEEQSLQM